MIVLHGFMKKYSSGEFGDPCVIFENIYWWKEF
jgi:hypothetical protein